MLARFKLGHQILAVAAVAAIGFLVILMSFGWSSHLQTISRERSRLGADVAMDASRFGTLLLQLRRHEKDFLLRSDDKYAVEHERAAQRAKASVAKLADDANRLGDADLVDRIARIAAPFDRYLASF